tara:strand:- start:67 stop:474 length:408 start_codon:yes stop_codon:yes gene_type:complete
MARYKIGMKYIRALNKAMKMLEHGEPKTHDEAIDVYWETRRLPTRKSLEYVDDLGIEGPDYYLYERLETFFDFDVLRATKGPSRNTRVERYLRQNFADYRHLSKMYTDAEYRHKHFIKTDPDYAAIHAPKKEEDA